MDETTEAVKIYFSAATGGFYSEEVHSAEQIPPDAVVLAGGDSERLALLAGVAEGKCISPDEMGYPRLMDLPPMPDEELAILARAERDRRLRDSDWSQLGDVPLAIRDLWATYRQQLRDVPLQEGFPRVIEWPTSPATD
ncbi:tail fiber assembly protein [Achromobacter insolitus]|uniref:tail fiber assembly protein n=1 Tax=Achromobacter insolitus TaxID=217204 RepID=UPI0013E2CD4A|nr:tail fiber assembly protein [Achromobacter insolitus]MCP1404565.1 hypothetical protein [Achromobacter insolitus]NGT16911.1 hypothetical protein [Achromobacter insolitus]